MKTKRAAFWAAFLLLAQFAFGQEPGLLTKDDIGFGPAAGSSAVVIRVIGNPAAGFIAFRTGKSTSPGIIMTVKSPVPFFERPMCDFHLSGGKAAIQLSVPVTTVKAASVSANVALAPSTPYLVSYSCMQ